MVVRCRCTALWSMVTVLRRVFRATYLERGDGGERERGGERGAGGSGEWGREGEERGERGRGDGEWGRRRECDKLSDATCKMNYAVVMVVMNSHTATHRH